MSLLVFNTQYYRYWCYNCNIDITVDIPIEICPLCNDNYIENISYTLIHRVIPLFNMDDDGPYGPYQQPAPKEITSKLPVNKIDTIDKLVHRQCSICLEDYQIGQDIKQLPCNHYFHVECLDKWFDVGNFCPICKYKVDSSNGSITSDQIAEQLPKSKET